MRLINYPMVFLNTVQCPYCGESFETNVDVVSGNQEYIEDCYVCCRPIQFRIEVDHEGNLSAIHTRREDE